MIKRLDYISVCFFAKSFRLPRKGQKNKLELIKFKI